MKQVELYNHNKATYENITRIFETSNKCATVQPTGSAKSFLIFKLAQDNSDKTIVVFEPNKQIIGRVSEQMKAYGIDNIKFYTYQKLNSQHKRDEISISNADYICLDELHRIKAKQWEQAVIAIQEKFPNAKVLGLTATPERMDGQNIIDYFGAELACNITLGDAIVNKILPCPTYISALYTFDEEIQRANDKINESRNSDEEKEEMREELKAARKQLENALGVPAILKRHIPDSNGKYIVFCQNVEHLNTMRPAIEEWFTQAGFNVHMYEVHTKNSNHKTEYSDFQADNSDCIKLCLCIDMFNEGVHLEGISGVILLRPTQSSIVYFQQIGRAISASDKNIPIIFDLVNNGNCLGGGSLRAEIESAVERQREKIAECGSECEKEIFNIGNFHIYDCVKDSLDVLNRIEDKCVDEFGFRLKQLEEYKDKWGHCCVMKDESNEWTGLYEWALRCSGQFSQLSSIHQKELIDLEFINDRRKWKFKNQIVTHIKEYLDNGNPLPIPKNYKCSDGFTLGTSIYNLKQSYKQGSLCDDYYNSLCKLGIDLNYKNKNDTWLNMYYKAIKYKKETNKEIETKTKYDGLNIGIWLMSNKQQYKKGKLSKNQINLLKQICDLDYCLFEEREKIWDDFISTIVKCKIENIDIKYKTIIDGDKIGIKLARYKRYYKQGKLSEERYQQLLELGIDLAKEGSLM